jgi:hypothetical protein
VYRRRRERFTDQCLYEFDRILGGSVMVWAGICHDGRTQLKIVQGTLNALNSDLQRRGARAQASLAVIWRCLRISPTTGRLTRTSSLEASHLATHSF